MKDRRSSHGWKESVFGRLLNKCFNYFPFGGVCGDEHSRGKSLNLSFCLTWVFRSNTSESTTRSTESTGVRQPAKSKIRRHNNKLTTVFNRSPLLRDSEPRRLAGNLELNDDPTELSSQLSAPGILKIFGSDICQGANYKSVLATNRSSARELVKEALER